MLLYYWAKITGMAPFTMIENRFHPPTMLGKIHTIVYAAGCCLLLPLSSIASVSKYNDKNGFSSLSRNWSLLQGLFSCAAVTSTLLIFLMEHEKIARFMNKLCVINEELKSLDIVDKNKTFFRNSFFTVVTANAGLAATYVTMTCIKSHWHIYMFIKFDIDQVSTFNMVLIFAGVMLYVTQCFELLNQKLFDLFEPPVSQISLAHHSPVSVASGNPCGENRGGEECLGDFRRLRKIELLHLELCDLIDRTTRLFAIPIIFHILQCCCVLTVSSFWIFFVIRHSSQPRDSFSEIVTFVIDNILFAPLETSIILAQLFIIAYASVRTCQQENATRAVLSKVWDHTKPKRIKNEFLMFSTQLLQKPVSVSIFGFFNLEFTFIFEVFCSVAVYFIITVQFDPQRMAYSA